MERRKGFCVQRFKQAKSNRLRRHGVLCFSNRPDMLDRCHTCFLKLIFHLPFGSFLICRKKIF